MKNSPENILTKFIENQTDMPPVSLSDISYIEISGQNHIEIDGIHKILECSPEHLRIRFNHCTVTISGHELYFRNFSDKNAVVEGKVSSIEYI